MKRQLKTSVTLLVVALFAVLSVNCAGPRTGSITPPVAHKPIGTLSYMQPALVADSTCSSGFPFATGGCIQVIAAPEVKCDASCAAQQFCQVCIGSGGGNAFGSAIGWGISEQITNCVFDPDTDLICGLQRCADVTADAYGGLSDAGGLCVATQKGLPKGHCSVGPSQFGVGDDISPNNAKDTTVTNINWLSNGGYMSGMMYKGADTHIYVQPFYNNTGGLNLGVAWKLITIGGTEATGWGAVTKWDGQLTPGTDVHQCWTQGKQIPGTDGFA